MQAGHSSTTSHDLAVGSGQPGLSQTLRSRWIFQSSTMVFPPSAPASGLGRIAQDGPPLRRRPEAVRAGQLLQARLRCLLTREVPLALATFEVIDQRERR